jgi:hypothetical protein
MMMDQTTNSDYIQFSSQQGGDDKHSSEEDWDRPADPPDNQGGGTVSAELPGVTQQTPMPSDVPPGGDA